MGWSKRAVIGWMAINHIQVRLITLNWKTIVFPLCKRCLKKKIEKQQTGMNWVKEVWRGKIKGENQGRSDGQSTDMTGFGDGGWQSRPLSSNRGTSCQDCDYISGGKETSAFSWFDPVTREPRCWGEENTAWRLEHRSCCSLVENVTRLLLGCSNVWNTIVPQQLQISSFYRAKISFCRRPL